MTKDKKPQVMSEWFTWTLIILSFFYSPVDQEKSWPNERRVDYQGLPVFYSSTLYLLPSRYFSWFSPKQSLIYSCYFALHFVSLRLHLMHFLNTIGQYVIFPSDAYQLHISIITLQSETTKSAWNSITRYISHLSLVNVANKVTLRAMGFKMFGWSLPIYSQARDRKYNRS